MTTAVRTTDALPKVPEAGMILPRTPIDVQVMHNGILVEKDCYYGPWMTEVITRLRGHHEPQEEVAFHALVGILQADTPAPIMVELGAYWGYYSLWLKSAIPAAQVLLVEPDPRNFKVGLRNFELNGMKAATVNAAVGAEHGATIPLRCESDNLTRQTRTVTLDGLLLEQNLPRVDLLLCDIQGAELEMLAGAAKPTRDGRVRFMVISTHWSGSHPLLHQECLSLVTKLGGHIIADHSLTESCSGDGLIVASFASRDRDLGIEIPIVRARDSSVGELEWHLARRLGWRGALRGVSEMLSPSAQDSLRSSRIGRMIRRRAPTRA